MGRLRAVGLATILALFQLLAVAGTSSAGLPLPPNLDETAWEGKYELVNYEAYRNGNIVMSITSGVGSLFRGRVTLDGGDPVYFNGIVLDGEVRMTLEDGIMCAKLFYDRTSSSSVWKMTGYWQDTGSHYPDRPRTVWFSLKRK